MGRVSDKGQRHFACGNHSKMFYIFSFLHMIFNLMYYRITLNILSGYEFSCENLVFNNIFSYFFCSTKGTQVHAIKRR